MRALTSLTGAVLALGLLAGCSSSEETPSSQSGAATASESPTQPSSPSPSTESSASATPTTGPTSTAAPTGAPGSGVHYVALGDSFVSGPGIGTTSGGMCARSAKNFPNLVAQHLKAETFTDASCAGATTAHYTVAQGDNPPQLDALGPETTLVTLGTMGGNDVGLVQYAASCVTGECTGREIGMVKRRISELRPTLLRSVDQVRAKAPNARILMIGYGTYLPHRTCAALQGVTNAEAGRLQGAVHMLSNIIGSVARQKGVQFVDMRDIPGAAQHTVCAPLDQQWIRGLDAAGDGFMFHPSSAGMQAMAGQVERALKR